MIALVYLTIYLLISLDVVYAQHHYIVYIHIIIVSDMAELAATINNSTKEKNV
ncbi:hypothetical protein [Streptococcus caballi]|uniref:hypothetical protein n=1 Tax=Streptococcus caballi TaxID=439220 RepID=UPI00036419C7|nr:hypothetical protein [Streptococcus caballi]